MKRRYLLSLILLFLIFSACNQAPNNSPEVEPEGKALPIIRIYTENKTPVLDRETWVTMTFSLTDPNNSINNISPISNQQIRGRGNVSWDQVPPEGKKPYRIRFRDGQQQGPLGLPPARNWVLLNGQGFLLGNVIAFELGKRLGLKYTCSLHFAELYLNNDYRGIYLLIEQPQADPAKLGAPGRPKVRLSEGWFAELDWHFDKATQFRTAKYNLPVTVSGPKIFSHDIHDTIFNTVKNDWNKLTELMFSQTFPENGYRDLIDMDSFAKYLMVQIIMSNIDFGAPSNAFFYKKDTRSKIRTGPLWDFDFCLVDTTFDAIKYAPDLNAYTTRNPFFRRFFDDPVFRMRYKELWNENYMSNINTMPDFINRMILKVSEAVARDQKRWDQNSIYNQHKFNARMKDRRSFYIKRVAWLNEYYNKNIFP